MDEENNEAINDSTDTESPEQGAVAPEAQGEQTENNATSDVNWQKANDTMKQQREKIKELEGKIDSVSQTQKSTQKVPGLFEGREKDDYPTYAEVENALKLKEAEYAASLAQVQFQASNPGAKEIIEKYANKLDPSVQQAIAASGSWEAAYKACLNSAEYYKDNMNKEKNSAAKKAADNAGLPGNASSAGGSGAMSESAKFENMSEVDILKLSDKYKMGGKY